MIQQLAEKPEQTILSSIQTELNNIQKPDQDEKKLAIKELLAHCHLEYELHSYE